MRGTCTVKDAPRSPNIRHDGHGRGTSEERGRLAEWVLFICLVRRGRIGKEVEVADRRSSTWGLTDFDWLAFFVGEIAKKGGWENEKRRSL